MSQPEEKTPQVDTAKRTGEAASPNYSVEPTVRYVPMIETGDTYILEISKQQVQQNSNAQPLDFAIELPLEPDTCAAMNDVATDDAAIQREIHKLFDQFDVIDAQIEKRQASITRMEEKHRTDMKELRRILATL